MRVYESLKMNQVARKAKLKKEKDRTARLRDS